jgi:hypothetical protein
MEGHSRRPIHQRYRTNCWLATKVGSLAPGMANQVSPLFVAQRPFVYSPDCLDFCFAWPALGF